MVSYSNTGYENDFFDVSDVYFNSTSQSSTSSSAIDLDELDARYLLKSGGTVSSNLIVSGSVDIKTALTLPTIGNVELAIGNKQDELTEGTNISILDKTISCDLTGSTNIDITGGIISATGLQKTLTGSTNIDITNDVISATGLQTTLTGSTNIDITGGIISATGLQKTLTGSTNIDITNDVISATGLQTTLTGSTNIDLTGGIISATGLQTELTGSTNIDITGGIISAVDLATTTDITTINKNNIIYNSNEYGIKTVSKWESRTIPTTGTWRKIVYAPELNLFVSIRLATENSIMTSTNGIVWESVINDLGTCRDIVWSGGIFVITHINKPGFSTSLDGKNWNSTAIQIAGKYVCITYSPNLNIFVSLDNTGGVIKSIDGGLNWASITTSPNTNTPTSIIWSSELNKFVIVYKTGAERVAYSSNGDDWFNVIVSLNEWNDIAWSPQLELFVAVAGTGDNRVMTSTDGITWTNGTIPLYL